MRRRTPSRVWIIALGVLLAPTPSSADVTITGFLQVVHTHVQVQISAATPIDDDILSSAVPPPVPMSVTSVTAFGASAGQATASVVVHSYSGPTAIGVSSPGLSINCDTIGTISGLSIIGAPFADAVVEVDFTLDSSEPYTYSTVKNGTTFAGSNELVISGGASIPEGSGILAPGSYAFNVSSVGAGGGFHNINLTIGVPEPAGMTMLMTGAVAMSWRRRRPD